MRGLRLGAKYTSKRRVRRVSVTGTRMPRADPLKVEKKKVYKVPFSTTKE
jgi:hypothetical protein